MRCRTQEKEVRRLDMTLIKSPPSSLMRSRSQTDQVYWTQGLSLRHYSCSGREYGPFRPVIYTNWSRRNLDRTILKFICQCDQEAPWWRRWTTVSFGWRRIAHQDGRRRNENLRTTRNEKKSTSDHQVLSLFRLPWREELTLLYQEVISLATVGRGSLCHCPKVSEMSQEPH